MKYYRIISLSLLLFCFSIFSWQFFQSEQEKEELSPVSARQEMNRLDETFHEPFNLVYHFYQAIEKNDWEKVEGIVTPAWWAEMHRAGYKQKWQKMIQDDPSINFVMFLVASQKIDTENDAAWVLGKVDWASSQKKMDDENETVFFIKQDQKWKISSIRLNMPVEIVEDFYQTIMEGDFRKIPVYLTKEYWDKLDAAEVFDSLQDDWQKNRTGVYCIFYLEDFGASGNRAWVKGDVLWNPLTPKVKETPVTIFLTNTDKGWKMEKIVGHWEMEK